MTRPCRQTHIQVLGSDVAARSKALGPDIAGRLT